MGYFHDLKTGFISVLQGMKLTCKHLINARHHHAPTNVQDKQYFEDDKGIVTLEYPFEAIPVPDHGRYRLHNEVEDCIVCDKCAVACPVNCIEIEAVKSAETIKLTSDGTKKKLYAARFDIDMAKCCYCGLCTAVCPTECLTMTKVYDYSEYDIRNMIYHFGELTPEEAEAKQQEYERQKAEKEKAAAEKSAGTSKKGSGGMAKPKFKTPGKQNTDDKKTGESARAGSQADSSKTQEQKQKSGTAFKKPKIPPKKQKNEKGGKEQDEQNDGND